jgi:ABC-2 type transport system ATP-binding protein
MDRQLLSVKKVVKQFGKVRAVDGLSFQLRRGEIFAVLGPNGAGKTTLLRMLMGIIRPDQGAIEFSISGGKANAPNPAELGYLPEDRGLYKDVPIVNMLVYFGMLRGMARHMAAAAAEEWLERLTLKGCARETINMLSKGNQQKVQFVASILHHPSFVVLDEPFSGLDPLNQELFLEIIGELRKSSMTILLSAHQMQLVERIADRVLLINHGREVLCGGLEEVRGAARTADKVILKVAGEPDLTVFAEHPAVECARLNAEREVTLFLRDGVPLSDLLIVAGSELDIISLHSEKASLHEVYVQAMGLN